MTVWVSVSRGNFTSGKRWQHRGIALVCEMPGMSHYAVGDVERRFVHTLEYGSTHGIPCSLHILTVKGPWQVKLLAVSSFLNHPRRYVVPS
jgi:hypothetical protein